MQVAVFGSVEEARSGLAAYRHPVMVSVPFGVLYRAVREQQVAHIWEMDAAEALHGGGSDALTPTNQLRPGQSYLVLEAEAGYSHDTGLTLRGDGAALGWQQRTPRGQRQQDEGREQTFVEHSTGAFGRAQRLAGYYLPFLHAWAKATFGGEIASEEVAEWLADAMMAAALFHDVGKLQKGWQHDAGWVRGQDPIARFRYGSEKSKTEGTPGRPYHATFAYPFLQTLFREANGRGAYLRPLEFIALAAARHHSLSVSGAIKAGEFQPFDREEALAALTEAAHEAKFGIEDARVEAAFNRLMMSREAWQETPYDADEAPGPSDDFYPVYCIAQRLLKIADWEDAGQRDIELRGQGADDEDADTADV